MYFYVLFTIYLQQFCWKNEFIQKSGCRQVNTDHFAVLTVAAIQKWCQSLIFHIGKLCLRAVLLLC